MKGRKPRAAGWRRCTGDSGLIVVFHADMLFLLACTLHKKGQRQMLDCPGARGLIGRRRAGLAAGRGVGVGASALS